MSYTLPSPDPIRTDELIASRCDQLGLALWRLNADGSVQHAPECDDAERIARKLRTLAGRWSETSEPSPVLLDSGAWVLPVPIEHRRARDGYHVALMESASPNTEAAACQTHRVLAWMIEDVDRRTSAKADLNAMTDQLMDAYETVQTLYGVGRAMGQIENPSVFVQSLVDELGATLPFAWLCCVAAEDATGDSSIDGQTFEFGRFPGAPEDLSTLAGCVQGAGADAPCGGAVVLAPPSDVPDAIGPQIVGQRVRVSDRHFATLIAGGRMGDERDATSHETLLIEASGGFLGAFLENTSLYADQEQTFIGTIKAMTSAIDAKDRYTRGHSERVARLSRSIALAAGIDAKTAEQIYVSGLVHDVGKIGVPESVLTKAGRLTDAEFDMIKRHPDIGNDILGGIPSLRHLLPGVLHHHERWDGNGYPQGLAGEDIPLMARVIGLADTFDAMSSTRSYRAAMPRERVLAEIERCSGSQFDPELAKIMPTIDLREYDRLVNEHGEAAAATAPALRVA